MTKTKFPAVFMRGGTSKALVFHLRDLPRDRADWPALFLAVIGSPDPNGRQLDGMGGGVSSLSKVCIVGPATRPDADVDYTFAQVVVHEARVDFSGNCGNMSSAIGPFAVDEGLLEFPDGQATVRIHNTNTRKVIRSTFEVRDGRARVDGTLEIPGVAGSGAPVRLEFLDPGGASSGRLLPTGNVIDTLEVAGLGRIEVSMVDAANACVFADAAALGLRGTEMPDELEADTQLMRKLAAIREHASVRMGITPNLDAARAKTLVPFIGFVSPAQDAVTLSGRAISASEADLTLRMISNGQPHRALPLTASLCSAVAARIKGTVVERRTRPDSADPMRIAMPSGVLAVGTEVALENAAWRALHGSFYRTARRLFEGSVYPGCAYYG
ncbi:MAG: PrpF family protein [Betaproteobacteria bacterium]|nr:PrpF family protein [Betaproteobacteria bacterium]